ncbi:MAG: hypoxanthine phosphoribosyltransferase [Deltaproteobacteria bacterium]|nr:hypoxanthine phosphoribosyltransferase [Deltaproteobacteria bacterium]
MENELANLTKRLSNQSFRVAVSEEELQKRVRELANEISLEYASSPALVLISVMKGAFIFTADLVRHLRVPLNIDFLKVSSYVDTKSTGNVKLEFSPSVDWEGKDVLIIEDIVDTGRTMDFLYDFLGSKKPKSLKICALFVRQGARTNSRVGFFGFPLKSDAFIVGYGLDYNQRYRELPCVVELLGP